MQMDNIYINETILSEWEDLGSDERGLTLLILTAALTAIIEAVHIEIWRDALL